MYNKLAMIDGNFARQCHQLTNLSLVLCHMWDRHDIIHRTRRT